MNKYADKVAFAEAVIANAARLNMSVAELVKAAEYYKDTVTKLNNSNLITADKLNKVAAVLESVGKFMEPTMGKVTGLGALVGTYLLARSLGHVAGNAVAKDDFDDELSDVMDTEQDAENMLDEIELKRKVKENRKKRREESSYKSRRLY